MGRPPQLPALLWAVFLAEGACRASVPFGWLPLKQAWRDGSASFSSVLKAVRGELEHEWQKFQAQPPAGWDFVRWLARKGYNANPKEWDAWERNVRYWLKEFTGSDKIS